MDCDLLHGGHPLIWIIVDFTLHHEDISSLRRASKSKAYHGTHWGSTAFWGGVQCNDTQITTSGPLHVRVQLQH